MDAIATYFLKKPVQIYYIDEDAPKFFEIKVFETVSFENLVKEIRSNLPFTTSEYVDVSIHVTDKNAIKPNSTHLSSNDDILRILKQNKIWVVQLVFVHHLDRDISKIFPVSVYNGIGTEEFTKNVRTSLPFSLGDFDDISVRLTSLTANRPSERCLLPMDRVNDVIHAHKIWIMKVIFVHYIEEKSIKHFPVAYEDDTSYELFLDEVYSNAPYAGELSIRVSSKKKKIPSERVLSFDDDLSKVLKSEKLWIVRPKIIHLHCSDEDNNNFLLELKFWPENLNPQSLKSAVANKLHNGEMKFELFAFDPSITLPIKIADDSDLNELLARNCKFHHKASLSGALTISRKDKRFSLPPFTTFSGSQSTSTSTSKRRLTTIVDTNIKGIEGLDLLFPKSISILYSKDDKINEFEVPYSSKESYIGFVRKLMAGSPFSKMTYQKDVAVLVADVKSSLPGSEKLSWSNFGALKNKKIWLVEKILLKVTTGGVEENIYLLPETKFGAVKSAISSFFGVKIDSVTVSVKNSAGELSNSVALESKLGDLAGYTIHADILTIEDGGSPNWVCKHNVYDFDYFLSHRQNPDKDFATVLYYATNGLRLDENLVHTFWDSQCLVSGQRWEEGFVNALKQTKVVLLFCSEKCLERVLTADIDPDNMLLEWELALEMHFAEKMQLFPIFIGREQKVVVNGRTRSMNVPFDGFGMAFPDSFHCHERSPGKRTVKQVMKEIFALQGEHMELTKIEVAKTKLLNILSKIKSGSKNRITDSAPLLLYREEIELLFKALNPLYEEMESERSRLLKSHVVGTRLWLIKSLFEFLNSNSSERVLWIQGNAGVGKSVMAGLVADELEKRNLLAGMFFAKHDDVHRNSARNLLKTLCYQLCRWNADFGRCVLDVLKGSTTAGEVLSERASIEKMFANLILKPLQKIAEINREQSTIVLVVDALDETGVAGFRSDILQVFGVHSKKLPSFVRILITTRPSADILKAFDKLSTKVIEPTSKNNYDDANIFAKGFLKKKMPSAADIEVGSKLLVEKSGGLFVWLYMACKSLSELEVVTLDDINNLKEGGDQAALDSLYSSTFDRIFGFEEYTEMITMLATIVLSYEPLRTEEISSLLHIPLNKAEEIVEKLRQVLYINDEGVISIFHKSVTDYLTDPSRCHDTRFAIDAKKFHEIITGKSLILLNNHLTYNIANLPLHTKHSQIPNFKDLVSKYIPRQLRYATLHFWRHYSQSNNPGANVVNASELKYFVSKKILNWIELLSLLKATYIVQDAVDAISLHYKPQKSYGPDDTLELLFDIARVNLQFSTAITESALQIYTTAIPFSPTNSTIYRHFIGQLPVSNIPTIVTGSDSSWPSCLMTLEGHAEFVFAVAISQSGRYLASGSDDNTVKFWSGVTGEELRMFVGHSSRVTAVSISPDAKIVVSGSLDSTVRVWEVENGEELKTLSGHSDAVNSVVFSADGLWVVSGSSDDTVKIWDLSEGVVWKTFEGHTGGVNAVAISLDGNLLISGSDDNSVKLWSTESGEELKTIQGHQFKITCVAISSDKSFIASGSEDYSVRLWSVNNGQEILTLAHTDTVTSVAISNGDSQIVTGSYDGSVRLWSKTDGQVSKVLKEHSDTVSTISITPDGKYIASGSWDTKVKIWSTDREDNLDSSKGHTYNVNTIAISTDGEIAVTGSSDKTVKIWSLKCGEEVKTLVGHTGSVCSVAISSDGHIVVSGSWDNMVKVWDLENGEIIHSITGQTWGARTVSFSENEQYIICKESAQVIVWDTKSGERVSDMNLEEIKSKTVTDPLLSVTGGAVVANWDGWVKVEGMVYCWIPSKFRLGAQCGLTKG
ncbi:hypothetical protein HK098_006408 [Nowakowskiella sp. JEL0407]|nr:hypothetical protein HK098_006408 [Nowakowskiella sp. JEL0407]